MSFGQRKRTFVGDGLIPDGEYNPVLHRWNGGDMSAWWGEFLFRPFYEKVDENVYTHVGFTAGIWLALLTVVGAVLNGLVFSLVAIEQGPSADPFSAFIVAAIGAIFFVAPMMWTMDTDLRVHTKPGIQLALIGTFDLGALVALLFAGIQFLGYAVAGWLVVAIQGNSPFVLETAASATTTARLMAYLSTSVVVFVYIYNQRFHNAGEKENENHSRVLMVTALFEFGFRLAFYSLGLRTFNAGLHTAGHIINGYVSDLSADAFADNVYYALMPLLAAPGTALLLWYLASFLIRYKNTVIRSSLGVQRARAGDKRRPELRDDMVSAQVSTRSAMQARTTRRPIDASF